jgi:Arylsulfotransferase (ASST)
VVKALFVFSLCLLTYFYGIGTVFFKVPPYRTLVEAKLAFEAWRDVLEDDNPHLSFVDNQGKPKPYIARRGSSEADSYILMAGGPGALMSICPKFGCMAWIIDKSGEVLHGWDIDQGKLWADAPHAGLIDHNKIAPSGLHLTDQGELIASFGAPSLFPYGIGIAKFDWEGNIIWKRPNFSHHWFSVSPEGFIYTPAHRLVNSPFTLGDTRREFKCEKGQIYSDIILVLNHEGDEVAEISIIDLLLDSGYAGLLWNTQSQCDPIHLNYIEYVTESLAENVAGLAAGDLIISARHLNLIAAMDGRTRTLKWVVAGRTIGQHSPRLLPDGDVLVFDNWGGRRKLGGSRIVRLQYGQDHLETVFPRADAGENVNFFTNAAGHIDPHPDGSRALVSLTDQGRVLEIDLQKGNVLWELVNTHDLTPYDQLSSAEGTIGRLRTGGAWYVDSAGVLGRHTISRCGDEACH